jgi:hypothetical protein
MMKIAGSGSGFISQRHGSADPDPQQNVMDPQHCRQSTTNNRQQTTDEREPTATTYQQSTLDNRHPTSCKKQLPTTDMADKQNLPTTDTKTTKTLNPKKIQQDQEGAKTTHWVTNLISATTSRQQYFYLPVDN